MSVQSVVDPFGGDLAGHEAERPAIGRRYSLKGSVGIQSENVGTEHAVEAVDAGHAYEIAGYGPGEVGRSKAAGDDGTVLVKFDQADRAVGVRQLGVPYPGEPLDQGDRLLGTVADQLAEFKPAEVLDNVDAAREPDLDEVDGFIRHDLEFGDLPIGFVSCQSATGQCDEWSVQRTDRAQHFDIPEERHARSRYLQDLGYGQAIKARQ